MERRWLFFLLLAWALVSLAQARRRRVAERLPEQQRAAQARVRSPCPPAQECLLLLPPLLPWALLLGLLATLVLYFVFKGRGDASDDSHPDVLLDEALLRDISGVLFTIRCRLCQIMEDRKKGHRLFASRSRSKSR